MKRFGSSITYKIVDLINIYNGYGEDKYKYLRNKYLESVNENKDSYLYEIDTEKIKKLINFINENVDSLTCENEMKMECYFNHEEPAFINDEVNINLFNFDYADKIYKFARSNNIDVRMHTMVWYRHVPQQLIDYLEGRSIKDRKLLTFKFIRKYMECLHEKFPECYCVDVINEMVADPDEINYLKNNNLPLYEYDDNLIRKDFWYKTLGEDYYIEVYKIAREVFGPNIKLFYNDNNEGNSQKQKAYLNILNKLKKEEEKTNLKLIDGFGMQSHYWGDETEDKNYMNNIYSFYTKLGLDIQITEFDVSNHSTKEIQNRIFNDFISVIGDYNIDTFTMWGLNDTVSWLSEYSPTIVNENFDIKSFGDLCLEHFSNKRQRKNIKNK